MGRDLGAASGISCTQKLANVLLLQGHLVLQGRTPRPAELLHNARTPFIGIIAPALSKCEHSGCAAGRAGVQLFKVDLVSWPCP